MSGWTNTKRAVGLGVALLFFACVGIAIAFFAGRSQSPPAAPQPVHTREKREDKPISLELVAAIRNADVQAIRTLLDSGANVNACDAAGNTLLVLAAFYANPECVELLISRGADVNA